MHFVLGILALILIGILVYALRWVIIGLLGLLVCAIAIAYATQSCSSPHTESPVSKQTTEHTVVDGKIDGHTLVMRAQLVQPEVRRATLVNPHP